MNENDDIQKALKDTATRWGKQLESGLWVSDFSKPQDSATTYSSSSTATSAHDFKQIVQQMVELKEKTEKENLERNVAYWKKQGQDTIPGHGVIHPDLVPAESVQVEIQWNEDETTIHHTSHYVNFYGCKLHLSEIVNKADEDGSPCFFVIKNPDWHSIWYELPPAKSERFLSGVSISTQSS